MKQKRPTPVPEQDPLRRLQQAAASAGELLDAAAERLEGILSDEQITAETPVEARNAMELAAAAVREASGALKAGVGRSRPARSADAPTPQQGQFLGFIREYMLRCGVAPTHADLQRFFNLSAPSVNSMLVRLERRGFLRRTPRQARGMELTIEAERLPALERPFRA